MEENKIEEGSIICAEFMDYKTTKAVTQYSLNALHIIREHFWELPLFHASWDWQIPVYSKLAKMMGDKINLVNYPQYKNFTESYHHAIYHNKPLYGFEIIIENLNWLNKIK